MVELKDIELRIKGMDCPSCAMNQGDGKNIRYSIRNAKVKELLENSDIVLSEVTKVSSSAHVIKSGFFQR